MYAVCINNSGNSGKSTVSDNLLAPRLENVKVIRVESINAHDGDAQENMTGKEYGDIAEGVVLFDNVVVDVGSSNVEQWQILTQQYKGSHEIWDYYIVPVVPSNKQMVDTIRTIELLNEIGVPAEKIRLIFNKVESADSDLEKVFAPIFAYHKNEGKFTLNKGAVVYDHNFFAKAREARLTIKEILDDDTDFNEKLKSAETPSEKIEWSRKRGLRFLAVDMNEKLDSAFKALFE
jgi:hypothetical protein